MDSEFDLDLDLHVRLPANLTGVKCDKKLFTLSPKSKSKKTSETKGSRQGFAPGPIIAPFDVSKVDEGRRGKLMCFRNETKIDEHERKGARKCDRKGSALHAQPMATVVKANKRSSSSTQLSPQLHPPYLPSSSPHILLSPPPLPPPGCTPVPALLLLCTHHTRLHSRLLPSRTIGASLSPAAYGLVPTTIISSQIPENGCIDLVGSSVQVGVPMMMFRCPTVRRNVGGLDDGSECGWSRNSFAETLLANSVDGERRERKVKSGVSESRRRGIRSGVLCEETVVGDVLLIRYDCKPISVEQVEGLVAYLRAVSGEEEDGKRDGLEEQRSESIRYAQRWIERQEMQELRRRQGAELVRMVGGGKKRGMELEEEEDEKQADRELYPKAHVTANGNRKLQEAIYDSEYHYEEYIYGQHNPGRPGFMTPSDAGYESGGFDQLSSDPVPAAIELDGNWEQEYERDPATVEFTEKPVVRYADGHYRRSVPTKEGFEEFWERYKQSRIEAGAYHWMTARSFWDV
ncbi:hypothetical protein BDZ91DRAFT_784470 [Kalaharituber pfeilii]|nr:hypothetical protein BDZ91DRAFT_784470 [Kalaharituber pfeilii]